MAEPFVPERLNTITGFCPGCGAMLQQTGFDGVEQTAYCPICKLRWLILWDQDENGQYGVMGFSCDNEDRTGKKEAKQNGDN